VLFPQKFFEFGVSAQDFEVLRPKEEVKTRGKKNNVFMINRLKSFLRILGTI